MSAETPKRKPGNPNWKRGGASPNPGGQTAAQKAARDTLRQMLIDDADTVHEALLRGIRADNPVLIKYAHEQLHGKAPDKLEADVNNHSDPFDGLTTEELRELVKRG